MAPADMASEADQRMREGDFASAIKLLTQALSEMPTATSFYIKRSTAYQRNKQHDLALKDAEEAVRLAHVNGKKELMASAQLRRGIALYFLSQIMDAAWCFHKVLELDPTEKTAPIWISKVENEMSNSGMDIGEVSIPEIPGKATKSTPSPAPVPVRAAENVASATEPIKPNEVRIGSSTPLEKIRYEWYQSNGFVVLTVFAKVVPRDQCEIDIQATTLLITFPLSTGETYRLSFDALSDEISPTSSVTKILGTKLEIHLAKKTPGQWKTLEGVDEGESKTTPSLAYPTSSRSGPKDWSKLSSSLLTKEDEKTGDELQGFFRDIFKDADEDTRKAMIKSYTESNGTSLSTHWGEVGKGKVETSPPQGMEAKRYS